MPQFVALPEKIEALDKEATRSCSPSNAADYNEDESVIDQQLLVGHISIKQAYVGLIVGYKGETIEDINRISGAHIYIPKLKAHEIETSTKTVEIKADTQLKIERAKEEITKLTEAIESYENYLKDKREGKLKKRPHGYKRTFKGRYKETEKRNKKRKMCESKEINN